jgi:hypothetical protein
MRISHAISNLLCPTVNDICSRIIKRTDRRSEICGHIHRTEKDTLILKVEAEGRQSITEITDADLARIRQNLSHTRIQTHGVWVKVTNVVSEPTALEFNMSVSW